MSINFIFPLVLFICSCSPYKISEGEILTNKVMCDFSKKMKLKNLQPAGIGGGIDHETGKHNKLKIVFDIEKLPDINYARKIIVETIDEFLHEINNRVEVRDLLSRYPFTLKNIEIAIINVRDREGLKCVYNQGNELNYYKSNPDPNNLQSMDVHSETYEEAVRILSSQT